MPPYDEPILPRLLARDTQAWEQFVHQYTSTIFHAARETLAHHCGTAETAEIEDITQDVFLKLSKNDLAVLRRYQPHQAKLTTWLAAITRNLAVDHLRRRGRQRALESQAMDLWEEARDQTPAREAAINTQRLSPREKVVMEHLYDKDDTVRETARALNVSEQTVRSLRFKALTKLRQTYQAQHRTAPQQGGRQ